MVPELMSRIQKSRQMALGFPDKLSTPKGYKYTLNHNIEKYPAAGLYGSWSVVYLQNLLSNKIWLSNNKADLLDYFNANRTGDGLFFPKALDNVKYAKSKEYMQLHCYNYTCGAALILDPDFDFHSSYMDEFMKPDFLERWLNQRSLQRPWEESNNIVNVASYLALQNDAGNAQGKERLYQMLEWHNSKQNSRTGGFEIFSRSRKNILQSMGGAVHNFHIHHYLDEPMNYEEIIGRNVIPYLFEGPLTACLSIDFVELGCRALPFVKDSYELEQALLYHLDSLLKYQNEDGGWFENESVSRPTTANGMKEDIASSNSYATWFRLCSIGMIMITLFGDDPGSWGFRKSLGMGYAPNRWEQVKLKSYEIDKGVVRKYKRKNLPHVLKEKAIATAVKLMR